MTVHRISGVRHSFGTGDALRAALESGGVEFAGIKTMEAGAAL